MSHNPYSSYPHPPLLPTSTRTLPSPPFSTPHTQSLTHLSILSSSTLTTHYPLPAHLHTRSRSGQINRHQHKQTTTSIRVQVSWSACALLFHLLPQDIPPRASTTLLPPPQLLPISLTTTTTTIPHLSHHYHNCYPSLTTTTITTIISPLSDKGKLSSLTTYITISQKHLHQQYHNPSSLITTFLPL